MSKGLGGAVASFIGIIIFVLGGAFILGGLIGLLFGAGLFAILLIIVGIFFFFINWLLTEVGKKRTKKAETAPPPPPP